MEQSSLSEYFLWIKEHMSLEKILSFLEQYEALGPLPGILLTMIEAFLPFLPLFVIVMANAAAFGLWEGFLYSWLGACIGAFLIFFIMRKLREHQHFRFIFKIKKVNQSMEWIERRGFGPLFLMLCFPFTPSSLINVVAGLSKMSFYQFILAVLMGKFVMIFAISWIGYDIVSLIEKPLKTLFMVIFVLFLWYAGKKVEALLKVKVNSKKYREEI